MTEAPVRTVAVIGASGDIGRGIVRAAVDRQWSIVLIARNAEHLEALRAGLGGATVRALPGSVGDDDADARLATDLGEVDAVVVSVSAPVARRRLRDWTTTELATLVAGSVGMHHAAARHLLPLVRPGGTFLGVGGGTADFVLPGLAPTSIAQAAPRILYRGLAKEAARDPSTASVRVLELLVSAMVNGASTPGDSSAGLDDRRRGRHRRPRPARRRRSPGPVLTLTSSRAVGRH